MVKLTLTSYASLRKALLPNHLCHLFIRKQRFIGFKTSNPSLIFIPVFKLIKKKTILLLRAEALKQAEHVIWLIPRNRRWIYHFLPQEDALYLCSYSKDLSIFFEDYRKFPSPLMTTRLNIPRKKTQEIETLELSLVSPAHSTPWYFSGDYVDRLQAPRFQETLQRRKQEVAHLRKKWPLFFYYFLLRKLGDTHHQPSFQKQKIDKNAQSQNGMDRSLERK